jgi:hypothetical protein
MFFEETEEKIYLCTTAGLRSWDKDGSNERIMTVNGTGSTLGGIAVDFANNYYWHFFNKSIRRRNLDDMLGDTAMFSIFDPRRLWAATVAERIYVSSTGSDDEINYSAYDGTGQTNIFNGTLPFGLAIDEPADTLFSADPATGQENIRTMDLDGNDVNIRRTASGQMQVAMYPDRFNEKIYFVEDSTMKRMKYDGTSVEDVLTVPGTTDAFCLIF